jgi:transposase
MKDAVLVPSCSAFTATSVICTRCGRERRLTLVEPSSTRRALELRTYHCDACGEAEAYLMRC